MLSRRAHHHHQHASSTNMENRRRSSQSASNITSNHKNEAPSSSSRPRILKGRRSLHRWVCYVSVVAVWLLLFNNLWSHQTIVSSHDPFNGSQQAFFSQFWTIEAATSHSYHHHQLTATRPQRTPTNKACEGYRGVYHIEKGDAGGAAGTIFFQFVIGQLIWAEKYNFKPWVYLNNVSYVIYDPIVHGQGPGVNVNNMMGGLNVSYIERPNGHWRDAYPGEVQGWEQLQPNTHFHFDGNGVWEDYFEPVSDFVPGDTSCQDKPLVTMDLYQVTPGVHGFAPWAPRCWRYEYLPDYVTKPHIPLSEWLEPQRHIAHKVLTKYIHFLPHIHETAQTINPDCSLQHSCLGIHIRQSDKAAGRRVIQTDEFLLYVEAFVQAGGQWIYLATDSGKVITHIQEHWPKSLQSKIRSIGDNVVRSNDEQAVFDIASHHRTNTEILIEILALSQCQFLIHGLSAVTESSIWINVDLHYTAVNLEDPDHLLPEKFGSLVDSVINKGGNARQILRQARGPDWWEPTATTHAQSLATPREPTNEACKDVDGILHIAHVGANKAAGPSFFTSVLNQLYYADRYNLKPWIHLLGNESEYIFDDQVHGIGPGITIDGMTNGLEVSLSRNEYNASFLYPGEPVPKVGSTSAVSLHFPGTGIWSNYFAPVSDFVPRDKSCEGKPIISLDMGMVLPGLHTWCPWSIRAWRYNPVPDDAWKPENATLKSWVEPMRRTAHSLVQKYFKLHPFIERRAEEVNPTNATSPCMAIHLRNSNKGKNTYRSSFPVNKFRDHINAFVRAGGRTIYIATDSHNVLDKIMEGQGRFTWQVRQTIRTAGPYVVRSTSKWPIHFLEKHHRTNSEALVDIIAMSKCQLLLHGHSTLSEAAIYMNLALHNQSVNWEDPDHMSPAEFEAVSRRVLGTTGMPPVALNPEKLSPQEKIDVKSTAQVREANNVTIIKGNPARKCRKNAIVYLAQKRHSTYDRDSYGILLESLDLIHKNYLSLRDHKNNADVIIFHTADFDEKDLDIFESRYGTDFRNLIQLVDLFGTQYWRRPSWHKDDIPLTWYAYPLFSEGYRRMMHWFAIDIWEFFLDHAKQTGCQYEYIMRFDEDSFLHSPIQYDVFDLMKQNDYYYGFRLCAYEMQVTQRIWTLWRKLKSSPEPIRDIKLGMCGVYNNFFVAKLDFFQTPAVKKFLHFVDRQGMIYRRRLGDLMIHSMAIYSFAPPEKIHRFLDFTYEHATVDKKSGCVMWGGIQAGYDDPNADATVDNYYQKKVVGQGCQANLTLMSERSLSPTYAHLPDRLNGKVALKSIMAGKVELPGRGILSG